MGTEWLTDLCVFVSPQPKCHQYWPEDNDKQTYGCFTVTNVEEIDNKQHSYLVRRFVVEKVCLPFLCVRCVVRRVRTR